MHTNSWEDYRILNEYESKWVKQFIRYQIHHNYFLQEENDKFDIPSAQELISNYVQNQKKSDLVKFNFGKYKDKISIYSEYGEIYISFNNFTCEDDYEVEFLIKELIKYIRYDYLTLYDDLDE